MWGCIFVFKVLLITKMGATMKKWTLRQMSELFDRSPEALRYHIFRKNVFPKKEERNGRLAWMFDVADFARLKEIFERDRHGREITNL